MGTEVTITDVVDLIVLKIGYQGFLTLAFGGAILFMCAVLILEWFLRWLIGGD